MEIKSCNDLRRVLAEQITMARTGKATPAQVNAICNATGKILASVRMELEYGKMMGINPEIDFIPSLSKPKK